MTPQFVLENPTWSLGVVRTQRCDLQLILNTLPGVVGGEFHAELRGIDSEHSGTADVTLCCTLWDHKNNSLRKTSSSPTTCFFEVERIAINHSGIDIRFLIPFEAKGTEEGATWQLTVDFSNGFSETFEVPVCRTEESNPEIDAVRIASFGLGTEDSAARTSSNETSKAESRSRTHEYESNKAKTHELEQDSDELQLTVPGHVAGRPSMVRGVAAILCIWVGFTGFVVWLIDEGIEPWFIVAVPAIGFAALLVFAWFGDTLVVLNRNELVRRFRLFGLGWSKRWELVDVQGFHETCVGKIPSKKGNQISYLMMMKDQSSSSSFLSAGVFNQSEARLLSKRLNEFLQSAHQRDTESV